jgi:hypothetical protein
MTSTGRRGCQKHKTSKWACLVRRRCLKMASETEYGVGHLRLFPDRVQPTAEGWYQFNVKQLLWVWVTGDRRALCSQIERIQTLGSRSHFETSNERLVACQINDSNSRTMVHCLSKNACWGCNPLVCLVQPMGLTLHSCTGREYGEPTGLNHPPHVLKAIKSRPLAEIVILPPPKAVIFDADSSDLHHKGNFLCFWGIDE